MSKDTETRYQEIVKDLDKNEELKKKVSSYLDEETVEEDKAEDKIEFISVTEAARRHGFTYITMLKTCMNNLNNKEYPFVRQVGSRLMVRPEILVKFLKGE